MPAGDRHPRLCICEKESEELLQSLRQAWLTRTVDGMSARKRRDEARYPRAVRSAMSSYLYKHTKRSPMVIPYGDEAVKKLIK